MGSSSLSFRTGGHLVDGAVLPGFVEIRDVDIHRDHAYVADFADGATSLKIVDVKRKRYLDKEGSSFWKTTEESGEAVVLDGTARPKVRQGFLEGSNVNPVTEMVEMIEVNRAYEAMLNGTPRNTSALRWYSWQDKRPSAT